MLSTFFLVHTHDCGSTLWKLTTNLTYSRVADALAWVTNGDDDTGHAEYDWVAITNEMPINFEPELGSENVELLDAAVMESYTVLVGA